MKSLTCPGTTPMIGDDYRKVMRYAFAGGKGANTFFCLGSTGEANNLCLTAKKGYIDIATDEIGKIKAEGIKHNSGLPLELSIGVTHENIAETVKLAQYAEQAGADYAVVMLAYITRKRSGKVTRRVGDNMRTLLKETNKIKFIWYNYPDMTDGKSIRTDTWKRYSRNDRIVRLKDSSGSPKRARNYTKAAGVFAEVDVGDEILGLRKELPGIVAGSTNILPGAWNMAVFEDRDENIIAEKVAQHLIRFQQVYAKNPVGAFKYIQHKLGIIDSPATFNPKFKVDTAFAGELDELLLDSDFVKLQKLAAA